MGFFSIQHRLHHKDTPEYNRQKANQERMKEAGQKNVDEQRRNNPNYDNDQKKAMQEGSKRQWERMAAENKLKAERAKKTRELNKQKRKGSAINKTLNKQ